ncbi:MAG TPA: DUF805 domain-containing protein [Devosia sp.]|nr:DUF805 domain-containing protein [Devosia sp.]
MSDALEGEAPAKPSLKQEANAARIGRARIIGHTIGILLILLGAMIALTLAGFRQSIAMGPGEVALPNRWVLLGGLVVLLATLLDLGVRRRHDRNRSGVDCVVALMVLAGLGIAALFGRLTPSEQMVALAIAGALLGYLIVTLAILPGNRGSNRYGDPPRADI